MCYCSHLMFLQIVKPIHSTLMKITDIFPCFLLFLIHFSVLGFGFVTLFGNTSIIIAGWRRSKSHSSHPQWRQPTQGATTPGNAYTFSRHSRPRNMTPIGNYIILTPYESALTRYTYRWLVHYKKDLTWSFQIIPDYPIQGRSDNA